MNHAISICTNIEIFFDIGEIWRDFARESPKLVQFGQLQKFALFGKNWLFLAKNGCK